MHALRKRDVDRIARRMRLMPRDIELTNAQGKVDRVEIFERFREVRQVQREKDRREKDHDRRVKVVSACSAGSALNVVDHVGRRNSPSFRLPVR